MRKRLSAILAVLLISVTILTGCEKSQSGTTTSDTTQTTNSSDTTTTTTNANTSGTGTSNETTSKVVVNKKFTANDLDVGYEDSTATHITFRNNKASVSGDGANFKNGKLTITKKGTYVISGSLTDGQIIVNAGDKDKVQLVFNGVSITCSNYAPLYIKNADKVFLTLKKGTKNTLKDGSAYVQTDKKTVDGVIYSTSDLTINGEGTLNITGNYKHGIVSKDDLVITGGKFNITTVKNAISGKNCVKIKDGTFIITSSNGKGIQSKNKDDETKGYVYIAGGTFNIKKCTEGIEGTVIIIANGTIGITASDDGLNASSPANDSSSTNNMSDNTSDITNTNTDTNTNTNTNTNTDINRNGVITLSTTQTAVDTDATSSATTNETSDNTFGRMQGGPRGQDGFGGGNRGGMFENDTNCYISITGGKLTINAAGDGIDSNGSLKVTGGNTIVSGPTNDGNGGLDYNGAADITGGTIIVAGSAGMAQGFSETSTQYSILYNLSSVNQAGTEIKLTDEDGKVVTSYKAEKQFQSVIISSPKLEKDATYTLTCGSQTEKITLSSVVTSGGTQSTMGGPRGGFAR